MIGGKGMSDVQGDAEQVQRHLQTWNAMLFQGQLHFKYISTSVYTYVHTNVHFHHLRTSPLHLH